MDMSMMWGSIRVPYDASTLKPHLICHPVVLKEVRLRLLDLLQLLLHANLFLYDL